MEILLWLVPPVVVTVLAMAWVGWLGREGRGLDREEAARRIGVALEREPRGRPGLRGRRGRDTPTADVAQRSSGVVVRRPAPTRVAPVEPLPVRPAAAEAARTEDRPQRRAS